jgi:heme/copper-type cytochrome/quinol oxidase subunit 2
VIPSQPRTGAALRAAIAATAAVVATLGVGTSAARAADDWSTWRLPQNFSQHGGSIDTLYYVILWVTGVIFVAVWAVMAYFLVKYRYNPDRRKGLFTHGNTRLEMAWTLIPAVILIALALWTKHSWDNYRYGPASTAENPARIMVVGQQFKWSIVYPGPDGKLGRYLVFPKTTDLRWPPDPGYEFPKDVPGPAFLPEAQARNIINAYLDQRNPLGKDFTDPNGKDDDWQAALSRTVYLPKDRPIEITLSSKDVIHDFFLPNYRVKLDAVPGMRGLIYFTATTSSKELEDKTRGTYKLDDIAKKSEQHEEWSLVIPEFPEDKPPSPNIDSDDTGRRYFKEVEEERTIRGKVTKRKKKETIVRDGSTITPDAIKELKGIGVTEVQAYLPKTWDLVCEELCGQGHYTMKGSVVVLEQDEYRKMFETPAAAPTTAPSVAEAQPAAGKKPAEPTAAAAVTAQAVVKP